MWQTCETRGEAKPAVTGRIQSGIRITLPLDKDYQDIIDYVVGLDLAYLFPIMK